MSPSPDRKKTSRQNTKTKTSPSAGPGGTAFAPPACGLDFLDPVSIGLTIQTRSLTPAPASFSFTTGVSSIQRRKLGDSPEVLEFLVKTFQLKENEIKSLSDVDGDNKLGELLIQASMKKDDQKVAEDLITDVLKLLQQNGEKVSEWKKEIVQNEGLRAIIRQRWNDADGTVIMGLFLEGSLDWRGFNDISKTEGGKIDTEAMIKQENSDFLAVMFGGKRKNIKTMNCWESVLYSAYMAGRLADEDLESLNTLACAAWEKAQQEEVKEVVEDDGEENSPDAKYTETLTKFIGRDEAKEWKKGSEIPRGNIVFFAAEEDGDEDPQGHVALSLGTKGEDGSPLILSLFDKPSRTQFYGHLTIQECVKAMAEFAIEVTKISYAPILWSERRKWLTEQRKKK